MSDDFSEALDELVSTEKLSAFSVVDQFCESCGDLTPHHIDESKIQNPELSSNNDKVYEAPISTLECVICRGLEESWIMDID